MPNPKLGTVTMAVAEAVAAARRGQAEYRVEKRGIVMAGIGKVSFTPVQLRDNLRALLLSLGDQRPEGIKGAFMRSATLSSTMGAGIPLDLRYIDPGAPAFFETREAIAAREALTAAGGGGGATAPLA
jgi:large subunit ribosomal protein L1